MSKTRNYFKDVIGVLTVEQDWKGLVVEIAKNHPAAVVNAAEALAEIDEPWKAEARSLFANGYKVDAIKLWRLKTGLGLKEAKAAVEAL
jgi:ribosomal protein L7/L12